MTSPTFSKALHGLRGVAAMGVFVAHCLAGYVLHVCVECTSEWTTRAVALGTYGVEIFFLLSGFVIYKAARRSTLGGFFESRFWRVYPVFILFTVLFFVVNHFMQVEPEKDYWVYFALNAVFLDLIAGSPALTPNAWTITFEVYFYILTIAIVYPAVHKKYLPVLGLGVVASLLMLFKHPISSFFLAGALVAVYTTHFGQRNRLSTPWILLFEFGSLALVVILASTERFYTWDLIVADAEIVLLFGATVIYFCTLLSGHSLTGRVLSSPLFMLLGTVSYTLYLAHPYSYLLSRKMVTLNLFATDQAWMQMVAFILLTSLFTVALVWAVHSFIEVRLYQRFTGKSIIGAKQ